MSVAAQQLYEVEPPPHAFRTIDEYWGSLPEDSDGWRRELLDGAVIVSPSPGRAHQRAARRLTRVLEDAAPEQFEVFLPIDVRVPGGVLIPDVVVMDRVAAEGPGRSARAADVVLVIEVESPSGRRRDRLWKAAAYAEAGIPSYWRVVMDDEERPELVVQELRGDAYAQVQRIPAGMRGSIQRPFRVTVDPAEFVL